MKTHLELLIESVNRPHATKEKIRRTIPAKPQNADPKKD